MVMEEGYPIEDFFDLKEFYLDKIFEAQEILSSVTQIPDSKYDGGILKYLSDILAKYTIHNEETDFEHILPKVVFSPPALIREIKCDAENAKSIFSKIPLFESAAERALINAGIFHKMKYIKFGESFYLKVSNLYKEIGFNDKASLNKVLSKEFRYGTNILRCSHMSLDYLFNNSIKDLQDYKHPKKNYNKKTLTNQLNLYQIKNEETEKFNEESKKLFNVLNPVLKKKVNLIEEELMNYFDELRDSYMNKDDKLVKLCISEIKKEVANELGGNSISIFGWPKEQTEGNIAKWINAYIDIGKILDCYSKKDYPNLPKDSKN